VDQALYIKHSKAPTLFDTSVFALLGGLAAFVGISLFISLRAQKYGGLRRA
jgi:hypothetical protein